VEEHTLRVLEFDKVRTLLSARAGSVMAKELCLNLMPATDRGQVERLQQETGEARALANREAAVPLGGIRDIRGPLRRAAAGGVLEPPDLLEIGDTLRAARRLKQFLSREGGDFPLLTAYGGRIEVFTDLESEIGRAIGDEGELADGASDRLAQIRRRMRSLEGRVREALEGVVRSPQYQRMLQEPIVTVRAGRFVVPVKQEYRGQFPGVVHDQSASGATLFIEPLTAVRLNNELRQAGLDERDEIDRILRRLSALVGERSEEVRATLGVLAGLDFIFARAYLALDMDATEPLLEDEGIIELRQARHPLLKDEVVPIDVRVGDDFGVLVLTGPNTGGKTVTLKTVGLCCLMAQCGLQIPAARGTRLGVFPRIFADIGDEQSIEQSLSTFSSHMNNIVRIVGRADDESLVLLDEIGAGTDPLEGAALAMALLDHFLAAGSRVVATTHYSELKAYAFSRPGVQNASVEFDVETLRPTFRVVVGLPGRSNAFEIASRLGLSPEIIEAARDLVAPGEREVESLISEVHERRRRLEQADAEVRAERLEVERREEELAERQAWLDEQEHSVLEKAYAEARDVVRRARHEADAVVRNLRQELRRRPAQEPGRGTARALERAARTARERLEGVRSEVTQRLQTLDEGRGTEPRPAGEGERRPLRSDELVAGMSVFVRNLNQKGYVLELPSEPGGDVKVQVGVLKVFVDLSELLEAESEERDRQQRALAQFSLARTQDMSPELHLRGMTAEEALERLDKYLDEALLAGLSQVRIVHGKGTGTLRAAVGDYAAQDPRVAQFRLGERHEGGDGVTIIILQT